MNSVERVHSALKLGQPDRVPVLEFVVDEKVARAIAPAATVAQDLFRRSLRCAGVAYGQAVNQRHSSQARLHHRGVNATRFRNQPAMNSIQHVRPIITKSWVQNHPTGIPKMILLP